MNGSVETRIREMYPDLNEPFSTQQQAAVIELAQAIDALTLALGSILEHLLKDERPRAEAP